MALVRRYDRIALDASTPPRRRVTDGCLVVPGRIARTGIQLYDDGHGSPRREYRPDDEVGDPEAIASFEGVAVTDLHPDSGTVSPATYRQLSRGHVQAPTFEGGWMTGELFVADEELARMVERGDRVELSAGYTAELDETPGTSPEGDSYDAVQRHIRGNHVALLPPGTARAGREARLILDSNGHQAPPAAPREDEQMEEEKKPEEEATPPTAEEPEEKEEVDAEQLKADLEAVRAERDAMKAQLDAIKAALADASSKTDSIIERRLALIERASRVAGRPVRARASDEAIMREALSARGIKLPSDATSAYLAARLDAAEDLLSASSTAVATPTAPQTSPIAAALAARRSTEKRSA